MATMAQRRDPWYLRLGVEARNVAVTIVLSLLALAALVGLVIGVTALLVR
jgi:hypothetical protein